MKRLAKADDIVRMTPVLKDKVQSLTVVVKTHEDATDRFVLENVQLDFSTCTTVDLIRYATRGVVIAIQTKFREKYFDKEKGPVGNPMKTPELFDKVWNVKEDIIAAERVKKSDFDKASDFMAKLTPEQRKILFGQNK